MLYHKEYLYTFVVIIGLVLTWVLLSPSEPRLQRQDSRFIQGSIHSVLQVRQATQGIPDRGWHTEGPGRLQLLCGWRPILWPPADVSAIRPSSLLPLYSYYLLISLQYMYYWSIVALHVLVMDTSLSVGKGSQVICPVYYFTSIWQWQQCSVRFLVYYYLGKMAAM